MCPLAQPHTHTVLHMGVFTHRRFYTQTLYIQTLWHKDVFTHTRLYTEMSLSRCAREDWQMWPLQSCRANTDNGPCFGYHTLLCRRHTCPEMSQHSMLNTFCLRNKIVRTRCDGAWHILKSQCISRHKGVYQHLSFRKCCEIKHNLYGLDVDVNGAHLIKSSVSAVNVPFFFRFGFQIWLAPHCPVKARASSAGSISKSVPGVSFVFVWFPNLLYATTACKCSAVIWPGGSAPTVLASLLIDRPEPSKN